MLAIAVALLGFAGGIDLLSPDDWKAIAQKWSLPSTADNERCIALIMGGFFMFMAAVRFLHSYGPVKRPVAS